MCFCERILLPPPPFLVRTIYPPTSWLALQYASTVFKVFASHKLESLPTKAAPVEGQAPDTYDVNRWQTDNLTFADPAVWLCSVLFL